MKQDVKDTCEALDFAADTLEDLAKHKADDGSVSVAEYAQTAIENAPGAVKAALGADTIPAELADLDSEEAALIASKSMRVYNAVVSLLKA